MDLSGDSDVSAVSDDADDESGGEMPGWGGRRRRRVGDVRALPALSGHQTIGGGAPDRELSRIEGLLAKLMHLDVGPADLPVPPGLHVDVIRHDPMQTSDAADPHAPPLPAHVEFRPSQQAYDAMFARSVAAGREFGAAIDAACRDRPCAVCGVYHTRAGLEWHAFEECSGLDELLLDAADEAGLRARFAVRWQGKTLAMLDVQTAKLSRPEISTDVLGAGSSVEPDESVRLSAARPEFRCCDACWTSLSNGKAPKLSLKRFDAGLPPPGLPQPTLLEQLCVSPFRPIRHIVVLKPGGLPDVACQKAVRGHVVAVPNPSPDKLLAKLPLRQEDLTQTIKVVLLAPAVDREDVLRLAKEAPALRVRGAVVVAWARHVAAVLTRLGHEIAVDAEVLEMWTGFDGVPSALVDEAVFAANREQEIALADADRPAREGYAAAFYGSREHAAAADAPAGAEPSIMSGLDEMEIELSTTPDTPDTPGPDEAELLRRFLNPDSSRRMYALTTEGELMDDYNPVWFAMVHVWAFPWGQGVKPPGVSFEEWCKTVLLRFPREQFGQNNPLLLDMFNVMQRHKVNTECRAQLRFTPQLVASLGTLSLAHVRAAADVLMTCTTPGLYRQAMAEQPPPVRSLMTCYRRVGARVFGSPGKYNSLRSQGWAMWNLWGPTTAFINLNPIELHASVVFAMAGKPYTFGGDGMPVGRPADFERFAIVATSPVAAAVFFDAVVRAFLDKFLGFPPGSAAQVNPGCPFGPVAAFFLKVETSGRGGLHAHMPVVLSALRPELLETLFRGPDTGLQSVVIVFIESVMNAWLPAPYKSLSVSPLGEPAAAVEVQEGAAAGRLPPMVARRVAPTATADDEKRFVAEAALDGQSHSHTKTCIPASARGRPVDLEEDCRLQYHRNTFDSTKVFLDTLCVLVKRLGRKLVPFLPGVLASGYACNHAVYLPHEQSRWARQVTLWRKRKGRAAAAGKSYPVPMPELPSMCQAAANAAFYTTKYTCKDDNKSANAPLLTAADLNERLKAAEMSGDGDDPEAGRSIIAKLMNAVHRSTTYSAPFAGHCIIGFSDVLTSHACLPFNVAAFVSALRRSADARAEDMSAPADDLEYSVDGELVLDGNALAAATPVLDYLYRPVDLEGLPAYVFFMYFRRSKRDKNVDKYRKGDMKANALARYDFSVGHPLRGSHMLIARSEPVIPQFFQQCPTRPDSAANPNEKDAYAVFAMALFRPFRDGSPMPGSLWDAYSAWHAGLAASGVMGRCVLRILDNVESREMAQYRSKKAAAIRRQMLAAAKDLGEALPDLQLFEGDSDMDDSDEDDAVGLPAEGTLDDVHARVEQMFSDLAEQASSAADEYVQAAVRAMPDVGFDGAGPVQQGLSEDAVSVGSQAEAKRIAAVDKMLHENCATDACFQDGADGTGRPLETRRLRVARDGNTWVAFVEVIDEQELARGQVRWQDDGSGQVRGPPPMVRCAERPDPAQTAALFTLSPDQEAAFKLMAATLDASLAGRRVPQLKMVISGEPGVGKSQAIKAFVWYAYQLSDGQTLKSVATTSYTWKAALNLATEANAGFSTCHFFGVNPVDNKPSERASVAIRVQVNLAAPPLIFLIVDEVSFCSLQHLAGISQSCQEAAKRCGRLADAELDFGGLNVVLIGDLNQHKPITGTALWDTPETVLDPAKKAVARRGRALWLDMNAVIVLDQQHRAAVGTEDGRDLYRFSRLFQNGTATMAEIEEFVDRLSAPEHFVDIAANAESNPHVIVLRNAARLLLNRKLAVSRARHLGVRMCVWHSQDYHPDGKAIAPGLAEKLLDVTADKVDSVNGVAYFFEGIEYLFVDNRYPHYGRARNNSCKGVRIVLHPDEPADDLKGSVRVLKHLPVAVWVRPDSSTVPVPPDLGGPPGCLPILPVRTTPLKVKLQDGIRVNGVDKRSFTIRRLGFPLGDAYAVTDYFAQGVTFAVATLWLLHLTPPSTGPFHRPSVFVALTRYILWSKVMLLAPLWRAGRTPAETAANRAEVVEAFFRASRVPDKLREEVARLKRRHAETIAGLPDRLEAIRRAGSASGAPTGSVLVGAGVGAAMG